MSSQLRKQFGFGDPEWNSILEDWQKDMPQSELPGSQAERELLLCW
jgi:hypothetical protein